MPKELTLKGKAWRISIIAILILIVAVAGGLVIWCWVWGEREKYRNRDEKRRLRELRHRLYKTHPNPLGTPPIGAYSDP
jgi:hypothetical protein